MMDLSRRKFFGLLAAPAVIRVSALMSVVTPVWSETYGPNGLLTMDMITKEFARQMALAGGLGTNFIKEGGGIHQSYIDMTFNTHQRTMSLEALAKQMLRPAAANLVGALNGDTLIPFLGRVPSKGQVHEAALERHSGIEVRGISDYNIMTDSIIQRFDVFHLRTK